MTQDTAGVDIKPFWATITLDTWSKMPEKIEQYLKLPTHAIQSSWRFLSKKKNKINGLMYVCSLYIKYQCASVSSNFDKI